MENAKLEFLTPENSVLLLIDYQKAMFNGVESGNRTAIKNCAVAAAKAAKILNIPVVYTSIYEAGNGPFIKELTDLFPNQEVIQRNLMPAFDAFQDAQVVEAVQKTGRKKLVISGLWTSMCLAFSALHALKSGYEVYVLIDAAGDASHDAHHYSIKRMLQAGAVPTTWMPLGAEWMNDWKNPHARELTKEVFSVYDIMQGGI